MRQVVLDAVANMTSPVKHLMPHIHEALVNVAPERRADFDATYDAFVLEIVDDHRWICSVDVENKHIRVSRKVVEVLWAAAFAYFRLYERVQEVTGGRVSVSAELEFNTDPALNQATQLLRWAVDTWINESDEPWPDALPRPIPNPPHASTEHVADELCLCAIAVILHHELAHIRLRHGGTSELDAERDADMAASAWIFDGLDDEFDNRFVKRA